MPSLYPPDCLWRPLSVHDLTTSHPEPGELEPPDPPHLCYEWPSRVEDVQRRGSIEKRGREGGKPKHTRTHSKPTLGVDCFYFKRRDLDGWSIRRRFLKTFRRKGEFSVEKLNLSHSSGAHLGSVTADSTTGHSRDLPHSQHSPKYPP